jgi:phosphoserine phosphatase RsbX
MQGESESGDVPVVAAGRHAVLVAAVDGLGHGTDAAHAAAEAARVLREFDDEPLETLVHKCHSHLEGSRGVALSVAAFSPANGMMSWLGVGNVAGRLMRPDVADEFIVNFGGIVGEDLPSLQSTTVSVADGDVLVLATDGIDPDFADRLEPSGSAQEIADGILRDHRRGGDDALVVVARYRDRSR